MNINVHLFLSSNSLHMFITFASSHDPVDLSEVSSNKFRFAKIASQISFRAVYRTSLNSPFITDSIDFVCSQLSFVHGLIFNTIRSLCFQCQSCSARKCGQMDSSSGPVLQGLYNHSNQRSVRYLYWIISNHLLLFSLCQRTPLHTLRSPSRLLSKCTLTSL